MKQSLLLIACLINEIRNFVQMEQKLTYSVYHFF